MPSVPSPVTGTIRELIVREGETVPTGAPIAMIDEAGATAAAPAAAAAAPPAAAPTVAAPATAAVAAAPAPSSNGSAALKSASPAVRRLAREHRVDVRSLRGSGANGRVTADDIVWPAARAGHDACAVPARRTGPAACRHVYLRPADSRHDGLAHAGAAHHRRAHGREPAHRAARLDDGRDRRHRRLGVAHSRERPLRTRDRPQAHAACRSSSAPSSKRSRVFPLMNARFVPAGDAGHRKYPRQRRSERRHRDRLADESGRAGHQATPTSSRYAAWRLRPAR